VLDIEGTTTPVRFVYDVLFPFARMHIADYVRRGMHSDSCRAAIAALRTEYASEPSPQAGVSPPDDVEGLVAYAHWLMDCDRKSPGLKALQGLVWEEGYRSGELHGEVFGDVPPALARWHARGMGVYIYSSGSVLAQKLLFRTTGDGDLTRFLDGYFDTSVGPKHAADSYRDISRRIGRTPPEILFVSDVDRELQAASIAGFRTALCDRSPEGMLGGSSAVIRTFDEILD
jgi:enolase-phosphatase E1